MNKNKYLHDGDARLSDTGLILFAHGSRNAAWRKPFDRLLKNVRRNGTPNAVLAFGEFMQPGLLEAAQTLAAAGVKRAVIVPLFLGGGLHVRGDLPKLAAEARARAIAGIIPGVILQPSGVFAVIRAQEAGCVYIKAS